MRSITLTNVGSVNNFTIAGLGSTLSCLSVLLLAACQPVVEEGVTHADLFRAIAMVESNGNDDAVGDNGASIGRYQIGNAYWTDALQQNPSIGGLYADVTSPLYAEKVIEAYMRRYLGDAIWDDLTPDNILLIARTHNGGLYGGSRESTLAYGRRVLALVAP